MEVIEGLLRDGIEWPVIERATGVSQAQFEQLKAPVESMREGRGCPRDGSTPERVWICAPGAQLLRPGWGTYKFGVDLNSRMTRLIGRGSPRGVSPPSNLSAIPGSPPRLNSADSSDYLYN